MRICVNMKCGLGVVIVVVVVMVMLKLQKEQSIYASSLPLNYTLSPSLHVSCDLRHALT